MLTLSDSSVSDLPFVTPPPANQAPLAPEGASGTALSAFFDEGGLTVYTNTATPWRWLICARHRPLLATVIDADSVIEKECEFGREAAKLFTPPPTRQKTKKGKKPFEQSRLIQWLTRAAQQATAPLKAAPACLQSDEDHAAFAALIGLPFSEWEALQLRPALTAREIRHFEEAHNEALSDIERAFLPAKIDLPEALALFYIRYLTRARRDVEATLLIAQSTHSTRMPRLMADALAVRGFEEAGGQPLRHEGSDYAASAAYDTAHFMDAALTLATEKLKLPVDHPDHLLRLNVMAVSALASALVEQNRLPPFDFLLKAKALYVARCDVCRFPPLERFATAVAEGDLLMKYPWARRTARAYESLFDGQAKPVLDGSEEQQPPSTILRFSR